MQVRERTQHRHQHLAHFFFSQRAPLKKLRQILIGVLHRGIQIADARNIAAPDVQKMHQIRMRQRRRGVPPRELRIDTRHRKRDKLQRNFSRRKLRRLRNEHTAVLGTAEKAM